MKNMLTILLRKKSKGSAVPNSGADGCTVLVHQMIPIFLLVYISKQPQQAMQRKLYGLLLRLPDPFYFAKYGNC
jgi:hypothetical protein